MKGRKDLLWGGILLLYGFLILASLVVGRRPWSSGALVSTAAAAVVLLSLGVLRLADSSQRESTPRTRDSYRRGFVIFALPVAMMFLVAAVPVEKPLRKTPASFGSVAEEPLDTLSDRLLESEGTIVFDETNYFRLYDLLMREPHRLEGRTVRLDGFVSHDVETMLGSVSADAAVGRSLLWCCAGDAIYLGLGLRGAVDHVPEGAWVEVEGTVDVVDLSRDGALVAEPLLVVDRITEIEQPKFAHVLPF